MFPLFSHKVKSDDFTHNGVMFFIAFDFIILSDLNSNFINFIKLFSLKYQNFFSHLIRRLFYGSEYFIDSFKNVRMFFVRISSNKLTTKFLCYCFLSFHFIVNFIIFIKSILYSNTQYYFCMFSPSNGLFLFASTDC